jgi:hypothetical protein
MLRHQLQGIAAINEREIFCIELAAGKTLDVVDGRSEGKVCPTTRLPPAQPRRDVLQDRLDDMRVVVDAELVRHRQQ